MDEIAEGKITEETVVDESQGMLETIFNELDKNQKEIRRSYTRASARTISSASARSAAKT